MHVSPAVLEYGLGAIGALGFIFAMCGWLSSRKMYLVAGVLEVIATLLALQLQYSSPVAASVALIAGLFLGLSAPKRDALVNKSEEPFSTPR